MPAFTLDAWVRCLGVELDSEQLRLLCPTAFHRERVRERFLPRIERWAREESGLALQVELALAPALPVPRAEPKMQTRAAVSGLHGSAPGRREACAARARVERPGLPFSFDSFVVGPCNALAREASFAVSQGGQRGIELLYLASEPGQGKTHLSRALVNAARRGSKRQVRYESAEGFTNRFLSAIRSRNTEGFKRRFREDCELLVIEDVQFVSSKRATQVELFHTITHLMDAGARVVLTGDRLPRDIGDLDARLRSQLNAGLVAEIEPPDASVRREVLRAKAAAGGVRLPDDCLDLLVEAVRGSVRDLEGALIQLVSTASLLKRPIDGDLTRAALRKLAPEPASAPRLAPRQVIEVVAAFFGVSHAAMASRSRRRDVLLPRQLAMYFCHRFSRVSLAEIARHFDRDHPAARNAVKVVERRILERAPLRYQVEELAARLDRLRP